MVALGAQAQAVPNGTLDAWETRSGGQAPVGWITTDDNLATLPFPSPFPAFTGTVVQTTVARTGPFAVQLVTQSFTSGGFNSNLNGVIALGTRLSNTPNAIIPVGVPYTGRPARLEFYFKLTGTRAVADSAAAFLQLTRTTNGNIVVVAEAELLFRAAAATYTLATMPLVYGAAGAPDTLRVVFGSGQARNLTPGTTLTIDDVTLAGTATAVRDAVADAALSVYPTSSPSGQYTLAAPAQPAILNTELTVLDLTGRVVLRQPAPAGSSGSRALALPAGLAPGLYTLRLDAPTGPLTRKLVLGL